MNKIHFKADALTDDIGKFKLNDDGKLVVGVILCGDVPLGGEIFFEFPTVEDVNTAVDMLTEYNARKWCDGRCGVRPDVNKILVGLCPKDFDDDSYVDFEFASHDAACEALDLVKQFCKYKFGVDDTSDDWEYPLNHNA